MSKEIKVGDLVQVARGMPCCDATTPMQGHIFNVSGFKEVAGRCKTCGARAYAEMAAVGGQLPVDVVRLKRIQPLEELEGQRTEEKLREPSFTD